MERRRSPRKKVRIEANLISGGENFTAKIENVSPHGIYLMTESKDPLGSSTRFSSGTEYEVRFRIPEGGETRLRCKVMWSYKTAPHGMTKQIGMEVVFPPPEYIDFCNETDEEQES
jgi:hypothetical protein